MEIRAGVATPYTIQIVNPLILLPISQTGKGLISRSLSRKYFIRRFPF